MSLTPEQKATVASWVAAGDNLSTVQKKLAEEFKLTLTYRDVRFLVDDLDLTLKDPTPKVDTTDVSKAPPPAPAAAATPEKKGFLDRAKEKLGLGASDDSADDLPPDDADLPPEPPYEDELPPAGGAVKIDVDKVSLIPGAVASGSVTFSDGVTGKWIVDQYGRPGFTQVSQPGYRPSAADAQSFMQELSRALQQQGY